MKLRRREAYEGLNDIYAVLDVDGEELRYRLGPSRLPDGSYIDALSDEYRAKQDQILDDLKTEIGPLLPRIHPNADLSLTRLRHEEGLMMPVWITVPNPNELPDEIEL